MTAGKKQTDPTALRMDADEFDRIMRRALQVKPNDDKPKPRRGKATKKKPAR